MSRHRYLWVAALLIASVPALIGASNVNEKRAEAERDPAVLTFDDLVVVDESEVMLDIPVDEKGTTIRVPGITMTMTPREEKSGAAERGSCLVQYSLSSPYVYPVYPAQANGWATLSVSSECSSGVYWEHRLMEKQLWTWVTKGAAWTDTLQPGEEDTDTRSYSCGGDTSNEDWRNKVENVNYRDAVLACDT